MMMFRQRPPPPQQDKKKKKKMTMMMMTNCDRSGSFLLLAIVATVVVVVALLTVSTSTSSSSSSSSWIIPYQISMLFPRVDAWTTLTTTTTRVPSQSLPPQHMKRSNHYHQYRCLPSMVSLSSRTDNNNKDDDDDDEDFASFAASLDDDMTASTTTSTTTTKQPSPPKQKVVVVSQQQRNKKTTKNNRNNNNNKSSNSNTWQSDLDALLFDTTTTMAQRQILISDLLNANQEIRQSVNAALRDRTIDPLLTPKTKQLQDGTRAVAYQIQTDILPSLTSQAAEAVTPSTGSTPNKNNKSNNNNGNGLFPPAPSLPKLPNLSSLLPPIPNPEEITKFSNRLISTVSNQMQKNIETFQSDLQQDPSRIPSRMVQQAESIINEAASNVFAETPIGLQEPPYTVLLSTEEYEIRDYPSYTVVTTTMMSTANMNDSDDSNAYDNNENRKTNDNLDMTVTTTANQGVAFNTLASYLFGANRENRVMEMTTPVTMTMSGEMRFYLPNDVNSPPEPLSQDTVVPPPRMATSTPTDYYYDTTPGKIRIEEIPATRLAVRRFTGFMTNGEIVRQKEALINAIQQQQGEYDMNDNSRMIVEIDVPHGQPVKHVLFQYNPPFTLPVLRRNEIAVPVTIVYDEAE